MKVVFTKECSLFYFSLTQEVGLYHFYTLIFAHLQILIGVKILFHQSKCSAKKCCDTLSYEF